MSTGYKLSPADPRRTRLSGILGGYMKCLLVQRDLTLRGPHMPYFSRSSIFLTYARLDVPRRLKEDDGIAHVRRDHMQLVKQSTCLSNNAHWSNSRSGARTCITRRDEDERINIPKFAKSPGFLPQFVDLCLTVCEINDRSFASIDVARGA